MKAVCCRIIESEDGILYLEEMPVFFVLVKILELFRSRGMVVAIIRIDLKLFAL